MHQLMNTGRIAGFILVPSHLWEFHNIERKVIISLTSRLRIRSQTAYKEFQRFIVVFKSDLN